MYLAGQWHLLTPGPEIEIPADPQRSLDVSVLTEQVLEPILGIRDLRTDKRVDFVGGGPGRDVDEIERRVDAGEHAVGFALFPTSIDDVMKIADAGQVMPPKSTWFDPKLRSGLLVNVLD